MNHRPVARPSSVGSPRPASARSRSAARTRAVVLAAAVLSVIGGVVVLRPGAAEGTPMSARLVAADYFHRFTSAGLGRAGRGGAYVLTRPGNVGVRVAGRRATFTSLRQGESLAAVLPSVTADDVRMRTSIVVPTLPTGSGVFQFGVEMREQQDGRGYRASVSIDRSGRLTLGLSRLGRHRVATLLGTRPLPDRVRPGQTLNVVGLALGTAPTALAVRAWVAGRPTPDWQLQARDDASTLVPDSGAVGEWSTLSRTGSSPTFGFEQSMLLVWALATPQSPSSQLHRPKGSPTSSAPSTSASTSTGTSTPAPSTTTPSPSDTASSSVAPTSSATATSAPAPSPTSTTTSAPAPSPTTTTTSAPAPAPTTSSTTTSPAPAPAPTPTSIFDQNYDSLPVSDPVSVATERAALGDPTLNLGSSNLGRTSIIATPDHGNVMRITMPANTIGEASGAIIDAKLPQTVDQASISYDIRFNSTFDWSLGGKLPGLGGAVPGTAASTAGGCVAGNSGAWSGRGMWITPGSYPSVTGANEIIGYTYDYAKQSACGDNQRTNAALTAGAWHTIKMTYRMNTIAANGTPNADGVFKMWIDGTLVKDVENFLYRNNTDLHINYLYWEIFRGGGTQTWASPTTGTIDFDNLHITTS